MSQDLMSEAMSLVIQLKTENDCLKAKYRTLLELQHGRNWDDDEAEQKGKAEAEAQCKE